MQRNHAALISLSVLGLAGVGLVLGSSQLRRPGGGAFDAVDPRPEARVTAVVAGDAGGEAAPVAAARDSVAGGAAAGPLPVLRGRVVDRAGAPVAGARVAMHRSAAARAELGRDWFAHTELGLAVPVAETTSDARGSFVFRERPSAAVRLVAAAAGFAPASAELRGECRLPVTVVLGGGVPLRGTVVDEFDRAVVAATVLVMTEGGDGGAPGDVLARTVTGDAGTFAIASVPEGNLDVLVLADGLAPGGRRSVDARRCGPVQVVLRRGCDVRGRVFDLTTNEGLAGARVLAVNDLEPGWQETTSDAQGEFVLSGIAALPRTRLLVRASGFAAAHPAFSHAQGFHAGRLLADELTAGGDVECDLPMVPGAVIRGRVVSSPDGLPIAGATVCAVTDRRGHGDAVASRATTDAGGRFELHGMPPGEFVVTASASGFAALCSDADLAALIDNEGEAHALGIGEDMHGVTIELPRGVDVSGVVRAADGSPVAAARVTWTALDASDVRHRVGLDHADLGAVATSDAAGRFVLRGLPADASGVLRAELGGASGGVGLAHVPAAGRGDVDVVLGGRAALRGRVIDPDGAPVGSAVVGFVPSVGGSDLDGLAGASERVTARTDADGWFHMRGLPAGPGRVQLLAPARFAQVESVDLAPGAGQVCELRAEETLGVRGRVLDDAGAPVVGCEVSALLNRDGQPPLFHAIATGSDGTFELWGLAPGEYEIRASHVDLMSEASDADRVLAAAGARAAAGTDDLVLTMRWTRYEVLASTWATQCGAEQAGHPAEPDDS